MQQTVLLLVLNKLRHFCSEVFRQHELCSVSSAEEGSRRLNYPAKCQARGARRERIAAARIRERAATLNPLD